MLAWCKKNSEVAAKGAKVVTTVWLPNIYTSISLDTESFRLRITPKNPIYIELLDILENGSQEESALLIHILDPKTGRFEIEVSENEKAGWTQLGDYGFKLEILDRKAATKKRKPQNA